MKCLKLLRPAWDAAICAGALAASVLLGAAAPVRAADGLPLTVRLADTGGARCTFSTVMRKGNGALISETSGTREAALSATRMVASLELMKGERIALEYPRSGETLGLPPKITLSGPELSAASAAEKKMIKDMLSAVPALEAFVAGRQLEAGAPLFADDVASMLDGIVTMAVPDAERRSLTNAVEVRAVQVVNGRPTLIASGPLKVQYVARGKWLSMEATGDYSFDVGTGLVQRSSFETVGRVGTQVFMRRTEEMDCRIDGPVAAGAPAAASASASASASSGDGGTPGAAPAHPVGAGDARSRLESLDQLLRDGLITKEEAARKRSEILKDL